MTQGSFKIRDKMALKNVGSDTYASTFQNTTLTAARSYTFADNDMTVAATNYAQSWTGLQSFNAGLSITGGIAAPTNITVSGTTWRFGGTAATITEAGVFTGTNMVLTGTKNTTLSSGATGSDFTIVLPTTR